MRAPRPETKTNKATRAEIQPGIWLDSRRALWFAAERLLVVADLHWGYAASHRARGNLLPVWGDDELETRLHSLLTAYQPAEMIWLGDVVHAAEGAGRAEAFLRASPVPISLVAGNHDRRWRTTGVATLTRGQYFFHHGNNTPTVPPDFVEIIGHHHPAVSWWDGAGSSLKVPVLVASPVRFVLPAFSPWAAGAPWTSEPGARETLWAITPTRIFPLRRTAPLQPSLIA